MGQPTTYSDLPAYLSTTYGPQIPTKDTLGSCDGAVEKLQSLVRDRVQLPRIDSGCRFPIKVSGVQLVLKKKIYINVLQDNCANCECVAKL